MFEQEGPYFHKEGDNVFKLPVLFLQLIEKMVDGKGNGFTVDLQHFLLGLFLQFLRLPHRFADLLLQFLLALLDLPQGSIIQFFHFFGRQGFALNHRNYADAVRSLQQPEAFFLDLFLQFCKKLLTFCVKQVLGFLALLLVLTAFKSLGHLCFQLIHQLIQIVPELNALAGRKPQGLRGVVVTKIIDIKPIIRHWFCFGMGFKIFTYYCFFTCTDRPKGIQVISLALDVYPERDGPQSAFLPDNSLKSRQFFGAFEIKLRRIKLVPKLFHGELYCLAGHLGVPPIIICRGMTRLGC